MTIFQHTHDWVLSTSPNTGKPKTATSRLVKPTHQPLVQRPTPQVWRDLLTMESEYELCFPSLSQLDEMLTREHHRLIGIMTTKGASVFILGNTYAIQPGRGKKAVGRFRVTSIERLDVRCITMEQVCAEGFTSKLDFWLLWTEMHDKAARNYADCDLRRRDYDTLAGWAWDNGAAWARYLDARPANRYDAWHLGIEVVR